jgi:ribosomal protein S4
MDQPQTVVSGQHRQFICSAQEHGKRIFHAIQAAGIVQSAKQAKKLIKQKLVLVNGSTVEATRRVSEKDVVEVRFEVTTSVSSSSTHTELANLAAFKRSVVRKHLGNECFENGVGNGLRLYRFYYPFAEGRSNTMRTSPIVSPKGEAQAPSPGVVSDDEIVAAIVRGECSCRMGAVRRHFSCGFYQARRALAALEQMYLGETMGGAATAVDLQVDKKFHGRTQNTDNRGAERQAEQEEKEDDDDKMVAAVIRRLNQIIAVAPSFPLHSECQDFPLVAAHSVENLPPGWDWENLIQYRIQYSYERNSSANDRSSAEFATDDGSLTTASLLWLDDKLEQVRVVSSEAVCGELLHLPVLAHALTAELEEHHNAECLDHAISVIADSLSRGEGITVKPRHGANSQQVALFQPIPRPSSEKGAAAKENGEEGKYEREHEGGEEDGVLDLSFEEAVGLAKGGDCRYNHTQRMHSSHLINSHLQLLSRMLCG